MAVASFGEAYKQLVYKVAPPWRHALKKGGGSRAKNEKRVTRELFIALNFAGECVF